MQIVTTFTLDCTRLYREEDTNEGVSFPHVHLRNIRSIYLEGQIDVTTQELSCQIDCPVPVSHGLSAPVKEEKPCLSRAEGFPSRRAAGHL